MLHLVLKVLSSNLESCNKIYSKGFEPDLLHLNSCLMIMIPLTFGVILFFKTVVGLDFFIKIGFALPLLFQIVLTTIAYFIRSSKLKDTSPLSLEPSVTTPNPNRKPILYIVSILAAAFTFLAIDQVNNWKIENNQIILSNFHYDNDWIYLEGTIYRFNRSVENDWYERMNWMDQNGTVIPVPSMRDFSP